MNTTIGGHQIESKTLKIIQRDGYEGFYEGIIADKIVTTMRNNGGLITLEDLENYKILTTVPE